MGPRSVTYRQPLRGAVAFLALAGHNAEEALVAPEWARAHEELLARCGARGHFESGSGAAFRLSLLGLTLALLAVSMLAARAPRGGAAVHGLLGLLAAFAGKALEPHLAVAVALRAYVPGVVTAVTLVVPAAVWVFVSTVRDRYATRRGALLAAATGVTGYAARVGLVLSA